MCSVLSALDGEQQLTLALNLLDFLDSMSPARSRSLWLLPLMHALAPPEPSQRVALVTGANKGIGKAIALGLAESGATVILACRDRELGQTVESEFRDGGFDAVFQHLDLTQPDSMRAASEYCAREYGRLDILVNNAAICFNDPTLYGRCAPTPFQQQARVTVETNFFGTLGVTRAMLPLLRASPSPRVINIASAAGRLAILRSPEILGAVTSSSLVESQLEQLMRDFVRDVEAGTHAEKGWPNTCYGLSKLGIIALTRILARDEPAIMVNSVDPGYCATDQNANQGFLSAADGADTPLALALLPADAASATGKHYHERAEIPW